MTCECSPTFILSLILFPLFADFSRWLTTPYSLRACCTNVVQLWTRVKSEFEPSSAANCVAPKRFKRWSPFNSELPSDHRSNFDLGSTRGYVCAAEPRSWTTLVQLALSIGKVKVTYVDMINVKTLAIDLIVGCPGLADWCRQHVKRLYTQHSQPESRWIGISLGSVNTIMKNNQCLIKSKAQLLTDANKLSI